MLKEFLKGHHLSIYKLAQLSGVPYSTLNDIVNYKVDIANIRVGIIFKIAEVLQITMDELYELCSKEIVVWSDEYLTEGSV